MSSQLQRPNRPRPPQSSESAGSSTPKVSAASTAPGGPSADAPKPEGPPRRPSRRPEGKRPERRERSDRDREKKVVAAPEAVLSHAGYKAGDAIQLPFSGKTVAVTHFYTTQSGTWYAAYDKGFVRMAAIAPRS